MFLYSYIIIKTVGYGKTLVERGIKMEVMQDMTRDEFKTIMEMVRMIIQGSKDKDEALKKIDSLTILKDSTKEND